MLTGGMGGLTATGGAANAGSGGVTACAMETTTAKVKPLDLYIMLDISGSMLSATSSGTSKWDAVKSALESFFADPGSQGVGVGIQYFPLPKPGVPAACTTDGDCGAGGPCFLNRCVPSVNTLPCATSADCATSGPNGTAGSCLPVGECQNDHDFACTPAPTGKPASSCGGTLGDCQTITAGTNKCFNPSVCDYMVYATPAVPITALSAATTATLTGSLNAQMPAGSTPTAPALQGAIRHSYDWAAQNTDHTVVSVLATDGVPTVECHYPTTLSPADAVTEVSTIATQGVMSGVQTFVIGVFGADDLAAGAPANLDTIANAGGTTKAFIVDTSQDVSQQFLAALNAIRTSGIACDFPLPTPTGGADLDPTRVNIDFTNQGTTTNLYQVANAAACGSDGGWYYDVPPPGTPTKIFACPTSCDIFQKTVGGSVSVVLGCVTRVK
jgi:hypothetical protein